MQCPTRRAKVVGIRKQPRNPSCLVLRELRSRDRDGRHAAFRPHVGTKATAGVNDFELAEATYRAAVARWPMARITLRQSARVVHESGRGDFPAAMEAIYRGIK